MVLQQPQHSLDQQLLRLLQQHQAQQRQKQQMSVVVSGLGHWVELKLDREGNWNESTATCRCTPHDNSEHTWGECDPSHSPRTPLDKQHTPAPAVSAETKTQTCLLPLAGKQLSCKRKWAGIPPPSCPDPCCGEGRDVAAVGRDQQQREGRE